MTKSFQIECNEIGPLRLSEITGVPYDTCANWSSGRACPDKYKQQAIINEIKEWKNESKAMSASKNSQNDDSTTKETPTANKPSNEVERI